MNNELVAGLEDKYQSLAGSFIDLKTNQSRLRGISVQKRRAVKNLDKYYRKTRKIVKRTMPKEKWPEFGIYDEK